MATEVAAIDAAGTSTITARANSIIEAEAKYDFYSAKAEQLRNNARDALSDTQDNSSIVDALKQTYEAMKNA